MDSLIIWIDSVLTVLHSRLSAWTGASGTANVSTAAAGGGGGLEARLGLSATQLCVLSVAFNPIFWNLFARAEHRTKFWSGLVGARWGCYSLAATIFLLGLARDHFFLAALASAPDSRWWVVTQFPLLHRTLGLASFVVGNVLVVTSMWALGVTGTYLGDYFGILMPSRVTGFPFNVTDNPMYHGSVLSFLGTSLWYAKPLGFWITAEVLIMYLLALVSLPRPSSLFLGANCTR